MLKEGGNPTPLGNIFANNAQKGSIKARVGPKNSLDSPHPSSQRNYCRFKWSKEMIGGLDDGDGRLKRNKFIEDDKRLPSDLGKGSFEKKKKLL